MSTLRLFLSYAREDQTYVAWLQLLIAERGIEAWYDSHLEPGRPWATRIEEEIRQADAVVVVVSSESASSAFVHKEIQFAQTLSKLIIPVLIRKTKLPLLLADLHYIDACAGRDPLPAILAAVRQLHPGSASPEYQPEAEGRAPLSLPSPATAFVGRKRELRNLRHILAKSETRLVTLTGSPGVGKTRLALEVAMALLDSFPDGCRFADLTETHTSQEVATSVASTLGIPLLGKGPVEGLVADVLEGRGSLLLILDNFEQVAEFAAETVGLWRERAPQVRFLVTSRCVLGLAAEREYGVKPLEVPPATLPATLRAKDISRYESVRLFVERAREIEPGFVLAEDIAPQIARICVQLEGIPLALELAAARLRVLSPAQIEEMCSQKFRLLRSTRRDLPARHRTLFAAIDWSYSLLSEREKSVLLSLCLFRGGFFLESAAQVIETPEMMDEDPVIDTLQSLREKSLVTTMPTQFGVRFGLYAVLREFCEETVAQERDMRREEWQELEMRYIRHYREHVETWSEKVHGQGGLEALDRLEYEIGNVFAAQRRALDRGLSEEATRLILGLVDLMKLRGPADQRLPRLRAPLAGLEEASEHRTRLLIELSLAAQDAGDVEAASFFSNEAVALGSILGNEERANALVQKGRVLRLRGHFDDVLAILEEANAIYERLCDVRGSMRVLSLKGLTLKEKGEFPAAIRCMTEAEASAQSFGDAIQLVEILNNKGLVLDMVDDYEAALECLSDAESLARSLGDRWRLAGIISNQGMVFTDLGMFDRSLSAYASAEALNRELGNRWWLAANLHNRGGVLENLGDLEGAIECYASAEVINRRLGTLDFLNKNIRARGLVLHAFGQVAAAKECLDESEAIARKIGNLNDIALSMLARSRVATSELEFDRALDVNREARELSLKIGNRQMAASCEGWYGITLVRKGLILEGRDALARALGELESIRSNRSMNYYDFQAELALAEDALGDVESASARAKKVLDLGAQLGYTATSRSPKVRESISSMAQLAYPRSLPDLPSAAPRPQGAAE